MDPKTPAENSDPKTGETPAAIASETLSRADLESVLSKERARINGEFASLRKRLERGEKPSDAPSPDGGVTGAPAITLEDLRIHREVGKLEAKVGEDVLAELGDDYANLPPASQLMMLKAVAKVAATRGETPNQSEKPGREPAKNRQTARAEASAPREVPPLPKTKLEFHALKTTNPRRYEELMRDETFDSTELPYS